MKQKLNTPISIIVALLIMLATFAHGSIADISIFHGMVLHPVFLLVGFCLFALVEKHRGRG